MQLTELPLNGCFRLQPRVFQDARGRFVKPLVVSQLQAHGLHADFVAIEEPALMIYNVTSKYAPTHDSGVRWNSFGFDWGVTAPVMSERDHSFPAFADFVSPF